MKILYFLQGFVVLFVCWRAIEFFFGYGGRFNIEIDFFG